MSSTTLTIGQQIAYIPMHAEGDIHHPDVEFGFVFDVPKEGKEALFCRYWRKGAPGELRTVANSEATPVECLVPHQSVPMDVVFAAVLRILHDWIST